MRRPLRTARPAVFWGAVFNGIYIIIWKQAASHCRSGVLHCRSGVLHCRSGALRRRLEILRRRMEALRRLVRSAVPPDGRVASPPGALRRRLEILRRRRSRALCRWLETLRRPLGVLRCPLETSRHLLGALRLRREYSGNGVRHGTALAISYGPWIGLIYLLISFDQHFSRVCNGTCLNRILNFSAGGAVELALFGLILSLFRPFCQNRKFYTRFWTGFCPQAAAFGHDSARRRAALIRPAGFGAGPQKSGSKGLRTAFP